MPDRVGFGLVALTAALFALAGLAEIGGGWLIWQWLRGGRAWYVGLLGGLALALYGVVATFQPSAVFGRVYAAYGGVFIALSLLWGWRIDGWHPDRYDFMGAALCLAGTTIILWPRT